MQLDWKKFCENYLGNGAIWASHKGYLINTLVCLGAKLIKGALERMKNLIISLFCFVLAKGWLKGKKIIRILRGVD